MHTGGTERSAFVSRCSVALLVLAPWLSQAVLDRLLQPLQERVAWLGSRPYLPPGVPLKTLTLLNALLQVRSPGTAQTSNSPCAVSPQHHSPCGVCDLLHQHSQIWK